MFDGGSTFLFIFLVSALLAGVSVVDVARRHRTLFDGRFTLDERQRLLRFALFVLLPLSVLAHEGGHALAVKVFGGEVSGFGFFLFYGYVAHEGRYTAYELAMIAFAGPLVNLVLGLATLAIGWYGPMNAPARYLALIFGFFELANALIFYPAIDALGGVAGDWETIYSRETLLFSIAVGTLHAAMLIAGVTVWRSARLRRAFEERTGLHPAPPPVVTAGSSPERIENPDQRELAGMLTVAGALATNGWRHPVRLVADAQAGGSQVILRWESRGFQRALVVHSTLQGDPEQHVELHAGIEAPGSGIPPYHRPLARVDGTPTTHELVPYIRRYLELVDSWDGSSVTSPN